MIKTAVKDTPTLLGNKLKQYYYKVHLRCWCSRCLRCARVSAHVLLLQLVRVLCIWLNPSVYSFY
jgi:hypothetical protein